MPAPALGDRSVSGCSAVWEVAAGRCVECGVCSIGRSGSKGCARRRARSGTPRSSCAGSPCARRARRRGRALAGGLGRRSGLGARSRGELLAEDGAEELARRPCGRRRGAPVVQPLPELRARDLGRGRVLHQVVERHAAGARAARRRGSAARRPRCGAGPRPVIGPRGTRSRSAAPTCTSSREACELVRLRHRARRTPRAPGPPAPGARPRSRRGRRPPRGACRPRPWRGPRRWRRGRP